MSSKAVSCLGRAEDRDVAHSRPRAEVGLGEQPAIAGVGDGVDHGLPDVAVVEGVEVAARQVVRWLPVITNSGRWRRIAWAMSRLSAGPYSIVPSGWSRNSTTSTPTARAAARCSASRSGPHSAGGIVSMPASPRVTRR
jgi:hypothetical protein